MRIVVIGLGSMGKRRVRLILEMYPDYTVYGIDSKEERRKEAQRLFGIDCMASILDVCFSIDCAFVCTSPLSHASIISECLVRQWNVFTELNLVDTDYEKNMRLARDNGNTLFLSSTFLYREEINYIRSQVTRDNRWNYIYHIGQYLQDWHPWESYKNFFIGDKRTNGCREIFAIELPWLTRIFGDIVEFNVLSDKMTSLDIEFNDNYLVQIVHENGNKGVLGADVVSPVAVRRLEIYTERKYISWEGTPDSLFTFDPDEKILKAVRLTEKTEHIAGYSSFVVENAYKNEIKEFFDVISDRKKPEYGFEQDLKILKLIDSMEACQYE